MRPFYAVVVLWLTGPSAHTNHHLATGLLDYWSISGLTSFNEAKGDVDNLYATHWYELWEIGKYNPGNWDFVDNIFDSQFYGVASGWTRNPKTIVIETRAFDLHDRMRNVLSSLETRSVRVEASSPELTTDTSGTFSVAMVGDSTMRMQAQGLFAFLANLTTPDGKQQCRCTSIAEPCICFKHGDDGSNDTAILRFEYHKVFRACVSSNIVADFVYFGCGLHILHHRPSRPITEYNLSRWAKYEKILERTVQAYRSNGALRSGYLGEAFMTTHSIVLERLEDPMLGDILKFVKRDKNTLAECYEKVAELNISLYTSELEVPAEDICTRGYFTDECVVDLNKRGKAAMKRLDVPIVPSYEITMKQYWATVTRDGRHYPLLVPQELSQFLGIVGTALKEEKLTSAS